MIIRYRKSVKSNIAFVDTAVARLTIFARIEFGSFWSEDPIVLGTLKVAQLNWLFYMADPKASLCIRLYSNGRFSSIAISMITLLVS